MDVKLLHIDTQQHRLDEGEAFEVRVLLAIEGEEQWHAIRVRPRVLAGFDASLLVPSEALEDRLRTEQYALHRICRLVGQELRGRSARLPQYVAA
jgi:hypothetical protein